MKYFGKFQKSLSKVFRIILKYFRKKYGKFPGFFHKISRKILQYFGKFRELLPKFFRSILKYFKKFRKIWEIIWENFENKLFMKY